MAPILWAAMQETVRSTRFRYGWSANLRGCSPLFVRVGKNTQKKEPDMPAIADPKKIKSPIPLQIRAEGSRSCRGAIYRAHFFNEYAGVY